MKNTGLFLLSFAGLIFLLHAVIPHHHHYANTPTCHQQKGDDHMESSSFDCHAFNDLVIDKAIIPGNHESDPEIIPLCATEIVNTTLVFGIQYENFILPVKNDRIPSIFFLKSIPVRGSPFTA